MNKKLRKLRHEPKQFFIDMMKKKCYSVELKKPKIKKGKHKYTVISYISALEEPTDAFFKSIAKQRLDFQRNIQIIMIETTPSPTSSMTTRWQCRFPNNIIYIPFSNEHRSDLLCTALKLVESEWFTFIPANTVVDYNYFADIDRLLALNKRAYLCAVTCNNNLYQEMHRDPIKTNISPIKLEKEFPIKNNKVNTNKPLSVYGSLFKKSLVDYDEVLVRKISGFYEIESYFLIAYFLKINSDDILYINNRAYHHNQPVDNLLSKQAHALQNLDYLTYLKNELFILPKYRYKKLPNHIQPVLFYRLLQHLNQLVTQPEPCLTFTDKKKDEINKDLEALFSMIDDSVMMSVNCPILYRYGIFSCFKKTGLPVNTVFVEEFDPVKELAQLRYFSNSTKPLPIMIDGKARLPAYTKIVTHTCLTRTLCHEHRLWLPVKREDNALNVAKAGIEFTFRLDDVSYPEMLNTHLITLKFSQATAIKDESIRINNKWLFIDRDIQADDNAEHLYRYIKENHPYRNIFFILRRGSHDWNRLVKEGFNMVAFGSKQHKKLLLSCTKIISSHADKYIIDFFGDGSLRNKDFIFLQHGVTKDDLSEWLNKIKIDCLITASKEEYASIVSLGTNYKFSAKEAVLTGFPRHDSLLEKTMNNTSTLLIMPTWRNHLVNNVTKDSSKRILNYDFMQSDFTHAWSSFLNSRILKRLSEQYGFRVTFFPHVNFQHCIKQLKIPDYITTLNHNNIKIQQVFKESSLMITDYSSVAFEMAFMQKPVIYYQFDNSHFYSGLHSYKKGYFDYHKHGFGPVTLKEDDLFIQLEDLLKNQSKPEKKYLKRMQHFFPFRDGNNCERTYSAILALDEPLL